MYERLGPTIQRARKQRGLTQAALATEAGLYRITIAKIEGGQFVPSLPALARIAKALKTEPWKLLK
jgi:transcriptional regulator with XRE-family HTH domain